jgi:hypothetical protein
VDDGGMLSFAASAELPVCSLQLMPIQHLLESDGRNYFEKFKRLPMLTELAIYVPLQDPTRSQGASSDQEMRAVSIDPQALRHVSGSRVTLVRLGYMIFTMEDVHEMAQIARDLKLRIWLRHCVVLTDWDPDGESADHIMRVLEEDQGMEYGSGMDGATTWAA